MGTRDLIFVNFRTGDAAYPADLIDRACCDAFGREFVFKDTRSLRLGLPFDVEIKKALGRACVMLVLIGPRWLGEDGAGGRLIDAPFDWVRMEIEEALSVGIPLVPILLSGARLPAAELLPASIRQVVKFPALHVRDRETAIDLPHLTERLRELPGVGGHGSPMATVRTTPADTRFERLTDHLSTLRWKEADLETARLLWVASGGDGGRTRPYMIPPERIDAIPGEILTEVDRLWLGHSRGRFGFTPQRAAWRRSGGDRSRFADTVGWRTHRWIFYSEADFSSGAPPGHLPILGSAGGILPFGRHRTTREYFTDGFKPWTMLATAARARREVLRTHGLPFDESLGWTPYAEMAFWANLEIWADAAKGSTQSFTAFVAEAGLRGLPTERRFVNMLAAAWTLHRPRLLDRLAG